MNSSADRRFARRFTDNNQSEFARLSGDANPLHVDRVEARRTLFGAPIVHGMHLVLFGLEVATDLLQPGTKLCAIRAKFPNPVLVDETVELKCVEANPDHFRLEGYVKFELVLDLTVTIRPQAVHDETDVLPLQPLPLSDLSFAELTDAAGSIPIGIDSVLAENLFPVLVARIGIPVLAELLSLTRLVGMRCPGLHSLFSQFDVNLIDKTTAPEELRFHVERSDSRFHRITIRIQGARVDGVLIAFFRPPPQPQPRMTALANLVRPGEFRDSAAFVIGGSRGLGEITGKLLAAGGGNVTISYYRGEEDARRVAAEISNYGGNCNHIQLDVLDPTVAVQNVLTSARPPRTIYYFATPHIFARRRAFFSRELLQKFVDYYVIGFSKLLDAAALGSKMKLRIFFPSTVAIDENLREVTEYVMAKRMAEDLCSFFNRFSANIEIIAKRLPRVRTDQTSTLLELPAEDAAQVMLPIVRNIELDRDE